MKHFFNSKSLIYIVGIIVAIILSSQHDKIAKLDPFKGFYFIIIAILFGIACVYLYAALKERKELISQSIKNENGFFVDGDFIYLRASVIRDSKPGVLTWKKDVKQFFIIWDDGLQLPIDRKLYYSIESFYKN